MQIMYFLLLALYLMRENVLTASGKKGADLTLAQEVFSVPLVAMPNEEQLKIALRDSPPYVVSFFNMIFSSLLPQREEGQVPALDQTLIDSRLSSWFNDTFSYRSTMKKTKARQIIDAMRHVSRNMRGKILSLLHKQLISTNTSSRFKMKIAQILSLWPDREELYDLMDESVEVLKDSSKLYLGLIDRIILAGLLTDSPYERTASEALQFFKDQLREYESPDHKDIHIGLIECMSLTQNIGVYEIAKHLLEKMVTNGKDIHPSQLKGGLLLLLESDFRHHRKFSERLIKVYLSKNPIEYKKVEALSWLVMAPDFKDEAVRELKKILNDSKDKPTTADFLVHVNDIEIKNLAFSVLRSNILDPSLKANQRGDRVKDFFKNSSDSSLYTKMIECIDQFLDSSDYLEEDKIVVVKDLMLNSSLDFRYLRLPSLSFYQDKIEPRFLIPLLRDPERLNRIVNDVLQKIQNPNFDKPDFVRNTLQSTMKPLLANVNVPRHQKLQMIDSLARIDFGDVPLSNFATFGISVSESPNTLIARDIVASATPDHNQQEIKAFISGQVDLFFANPSFVNQSLIVLLLQTPSIDPAFTNPLKQRLLQSNRLGTEALSLLLSNFLNQANESLKNEAIRHIQEILPKMKLFELKPLVQNIYGVFPETLKNQMAGHTLDLINSQSKEAKKSLNKPFPKDPSKIEILKAEKKQAAETLKQISSLLQIITHSVPDERIKMQLQDLELNFASHETFMFQPRDRMNLLEHFYATPRLSEEKKQIALKSMKEFLSSGHFSLGIREEALRHYRSKIRANGYEQVFCKIFEEMLNFEHNITGGHAMSENVHDKKVLNQTNIFLKKMLEGEAPERRKIIPQQEVRMLDDINGILGNLSEELITILTLSAQLNNKEDYIDSARKRIQIMWTAQSVADHSSEKAMQWYGTANTSEIVVLDHPEKGVQHPITQGRALQLVYDLMKKNHPSSQLYKDSLVALIEILGSDNAMNACREGSIGGIIRAAQATYDGDKTAASEKFNKQTDGNILTVNLPQLKSLMIAMLDLWKIDRRIFNKPLRSSDYPMLKTGFIDLITKENHVMQEFLKTLGTLGWDTILADLRGKSLYQLFQQEPTNVGEERIKDDVDTLLITPAIRAFVYGQYKTFLMNNSLDISEYVNPFALKYIDVVPSGVDVRSSHAATRIQSLMRGKLVRKQIKP